MSVSTEVPVPSTLTPELVARLAALAGLPEATAALALRGLGYGSRTSLIAHGIVDGAALNGGDHDAAVLTPYGRKVIDACATVGPTPAHEPAEFLLADRGGAPMHVGAVARFTGPPPSHAEVVAHIRARLLQHPRFSQTLVTPLGALGGHVWTDDAGFDLEHHVRQVSAPEHGGLERLVADVFAQRLDRTRPLWEIWVACRLDDGGFAVITKVHHLLLESMSGGDLVSTLYDLTADPTPVGSSPPWTPAEEPSTVERAVSSLGSVVMGAAGMPRRVLGAAASPTRTLAQVLHAAGLVRAGLRGAPASPLNVSISARRRVAFAGVPLADVELARDAFECTINDVLLAATAGALQSWMRSRGLPVDGPALKAASISIRPANDDRPLEARLTQRLVELPIDEPEAGGRLRAVRAATERCRAASAPHGADQMLARMHQLTGTTLGLQIARLILSQRFYNVMVARLPGASLELYFMGREVRTLHPLAFLAENHALAISAVPYGDHLQVGLIGDQNAMYDLDVVGEAIEAEVRELAAATGPRRPKPKRAVTR